ncbi:MAG: diaminopimelate epimerase [Anaerolineae bacterium]|nr:diaminopimelate epimerase [Anaerolineales bacterium]MCQ3979388.1 diaminopimelate epimerase [Anaerolineae bacterium]
MNAHFYKYQALGNDMVVIDPARFAFPLTPATIRHICDRHFGLGADGVCYGPLPGGPHPRQMRFFNPDGSESGKSGNGLRIFARYLWDQGYAQNWVFEIGIGGEVVTVEVKDAAAQTLTIAMGRLSFHSHDIPVSGPAREVVNEAVRLAGRDYQITAVTIGNPHCVIFTEEVSEAAARAAGPAIEGDALFPERTNVQFARVVDRHTLQIEIWERGAGYTLASGTSSCAAAGAAVKTGQCDSPVEVQMAGGAAQVEIDQQWRVRLTGEVEAIASGIFAPNLVAKFLS